MNKKYNKFFWTHVNYYKIMANYDYNDKKYRIVDAPYDQQVIWNVTNHPNQVLIFYDLDDDKKEMELLYIHLFKLDSLFMEKTTKQKITKQKNGLDADTYITQTAKIIK